MWRKKYLHGDGGRGGEGGAALDLHVGGSAPLSSASSSPGSKALMASTACQSFSRSTVRKAREARRACFRSRGRRLYGATSPSVCNHDGRREGGLAGGRSASTFSPPLPPPPSPSAFAASPGPCRMTPPERRGPTPASLSLFVVDGAEASVPWRAWWSHRRPDPSVARSVVDSNAAAGALDGADSVVGCPIVTITHHYFYAGASVAGVMGGNGVASR